MSADSGHGWHSSERHQTEDYSVAKDGLNLLLGQDIATSRLQPVASGILLHSQYSIE